MSFECEIIKGNVSVNFSAIILPTTKIFFQIKKECLLTESNKKNNNLKQQNIHQSETEEYKNSTEIYDKIMKNKQALAGPNPIEKDHYIFALQITSDQHKIVTYGVTKPSFTLDEVKYLEKSDSPSYIDEYTSKMDFKVISLSSKL